MANTKNETTKTPTLDLGAGYIPETMEMTLEEVPVAKTTPIKDERKCGLCFKLAVEDDEAKSKTYALYRCRGCGSTWGVKRSWLLQYADRFDAAYAEK